MSVANHPTTSTMGEDNGCASMSTASSPSTSTENIVGFLARSKPKDICPVRRNGRVYSLAKRFEAAARGPATMIKVQRLNSTSRGHIGTLRYYGRGIARKKSSLNRRIQSAGDVRYVSTTICGTTARRVKSTGAVVVVDGDRPLTKDLDKVSIVKIAAMTVAHQHQRPVQSPPHPPPKPSKTMIARSLRSLNPAPEDEPCASTSSSTTSPSPVPSTRLIPAEKPWLRSKSAVRKPSIKPPPPPIAVKATWQREEEVNQGGCCRSGSVSMSDIYQAVSSPECEEGGQRWCTEDDIRPSLPTVPPPCVPKSKESKDDEHFDEVYEDIDADRPATTSTDTTRAVPYSPIFQKRSQQQRHHNRSREYTSYEEVESSLGDNGHRDHNSLDQPVLRMQQSMFANPYQSHDDETFKSNTPKQYRNQFGTWRPGVNGGGKSQRKSRPPSAGPLEFEKLMRIKSEIQLNISRKMDRIKSRVTHTSPSLHLKSKKQHLFNSVYVDPKILETDQRPTTSTSAKCYDDSALYGDDWSSVEEALAESEYHTSDGYALGKSKSMSHATALSVKNLSSVYSETEGDKAGPSNSLLDEIESEYMETERRKLPETGTIRRPTQLPPPAPVKEVLSAFKEASSSSTSSLPSLPAVLSPETPSYEDEDDETDDEDLTPLDDNVNLRMQSSLTLSSKSDSPDADDAEHNKEAYMSRLPDEQPLYQIYMLQEREKMLDVNNSVTTSGASSTAGDSKQVDDVDSVCGSAEHEDALSLIRRQSSSASTDSGRGGDTSSHVTSNTSMRRERLTAASIYGSQRSLWCELPEVKSAGLLQRLDEDSKKLQEAFFEVITSEASYLRSINILISRFMATPELCGGTHLLGGIQKPSIISPPERKHLFSNIVKVRDCSESLLVDLENRLEECLVLSDVCDLLCDHFENRFDAYVKYCSNQVYQDRTLKCLKALNQPFVQCVTRIEADRQCQGLDIRSFLMLPMQRVTRYPLLIYAILERLSPDSAVHKNATRALLLANQVVRDCNEGARRMERTEQLLGIERRLVYKSANLKRIPLVTTGRYIVKSGLVLEVYDRRAKGLLQSKQKTRNLHLFLFSDMILIAKRRVNGTYVCRDYAQRRFIVVEPVEAHSHKIPTGALASITGKPHFFICALLQNAFGKQVEYLLNVDSESDRERWVSAMRPPTCSNPDEKIYAEWDCPQAVAVHAYIAGQDDELHLEPGDLVNILRKMPDGWFYGERTRDSRGGWFPSSYVQEVLNDHVRANNFRTRFKVFEAAALYRAQKIASERAAVAGALPGLTSLPPGSTTPLIERLRRLSHPKGFFVNS